MTQVVDVVFPLLGRKQALPSDHSYALYGAISSLKPELHGVPWLGIFPIGNVKKRALLGDLVTDQISYLRLRVPDNRIGEVLGLVGATLKILNADLRVRSPSIYQLEPCKSLDAFRVTFNLTRLESTDGWDLARELFLDSAKRHLDEMGVTCDLAITGKQRLGIKGIQRMCFSIRCTNFGSDDQSITLQAQGLGGKRSFGCGLFRITRSEWNY